MAYRPHSSLAVRLLRASTAAITVWCLGCSAFDPLLSQLAGRSAGAMICADDEPAGGAATALAEQDPGGARVRATADDDGQSGDALCDCQSCTAPSPAPLLAVIPGSPLPRLAAVPSATPT